MAGPLRVSSENPRYFTDSTGKAIYLTGSHTWSNFKDIGTTNPPVPFDFGAYLDLLKKFNHNFVRLWTWELCKFAYSGETMKYAVPFPWPRTGPGLALDCRPKFDLSRLDEGYFQRLRQRIQFARERGIYVSIMLFEGYAINAFTPPWNSQGHPFHAGNNINGIDGDAAQAGKGPELFTLGRPDIRSIQEAYVLKVIETVNDFDNILFEIGNEMHGGSTEFQYHMIRLIKEYEAMKPKQHPVGMTFQYDSTTRGTNADLMASPADWVSPGEEPGMSFKDDPPPADGKKVVLLDSDHLWGVGGDRAWVWKSFLRGHHPIYMDPFDDDRVHEDTRRAMGQTLSYARRMHLSAMRPWGELSSTGYCLANPGSEYLVYRPKATSLSARIFERRLGVELVSGTYSYEWFDLSSATVIPGGSFTAEDGRRFFTPAFKGDAVLYVHRS